MSGENVNPSVRHERRDVNLRALRFILLGGIVGAALAHVGLTMLFAFYEAQHARTAPPASPLALVDSQTPPPPRLQIDTVRDLQALRKAEQAHLSHYGWINRNAGEVQIPIDRTFDLIVERGLPQWNALGNDKKVRP